MAEFFGRQQVPLKILKNCSLPFCVNGLPERSKLLNFPGRSMRANANHGPVLLEARREQWVGTNQLLAASFELLGTTCVLKIRVRSRAFAAKDFAVGFGFGFAVACCLLCGLLPGPSLFPVPCNL